MGLSRTLRHSETTSTGSLSQLAFSITTSRQHRHCKVVPEEPPQVAPKKENTLDEGYLRSWWGKHSVSRRYGLVSPVRTVLSYFVHHKWRNVGERCPPGIRRKRTVLIIHLALMLRLNRENSLLSMTCLNCFSTWHELTGGGRQLWKREVSTILSLHLNVKPQLSRLSWSPPTQSKMLPTSVWP